MKRWMVLPVLLILTGCDYLAPEVSKAITEKQQYQELQKSSELQRRQADALERIAAALEKGRCQ